jgi:hypothetical protein
VRPSRGGLTIAYRASIRDLHARLSERGFDWRFIRSFILPEWWEDEMADHEADRALAEAYIARYLGFRAEELREPSRELTPPKLTEVRFKRYKNHVDQQVMTSAFLAQQIARTVVRNIEERLPCPELRQSAAAIRAAILRRHEYVDLNSLLDHAWRSGIPVLHLAHVPGKGKRFDGMAAFIGQRPVVILASGRNGPAWLAFHLAHELGHLLLGHVQPGGALLDETLASESGPSTHEKEADRFACEVLTGFAEPRIADLRAKGPRLAVVAAQIGPDQGIDPGVLALIYAKSNNRWPVAQNALKLLDLESGGPELVREHLHRHLNEADLSDSDRRFLSLLEAA